jgi:hypothetical protein
LLWNNVRGLGTDHRERERSNRGQFAKGDQVVDRRTEEVGVVLRVELAGRSTIYRVQFASGSRCLGEEQLETATLEPLDRLRERSFGHLHAYHLRLRALLLEQAYRYDAYSGVGKRPDRAEAAPRTDRSHHARRRPVVGSEASNFIRSLAQPVIARSIYPCWCELPRT